MRLIVNTDSDNRTYKNGAFYLHYETFSKNDIKEVEISILSRLTLRSVEKAPWLFGTGTMVTDKKAVDKILDYFTYLPLLSSTHEVKRYDDHSFDVDLSFNDSTHNPVANIIIQGDFLVFTIYNTSTIHHAGPKDAFKRKVYKLKDGNNIVSELENLK